VQVGAENFLPLHFPKIYDEPFFLVTILERQAFVFIFGGCASATQREG
jgi:hypothetical protein